MTLRVSKLGVERWALGVERLLLPLSVGRSALGAERFLL
jgi:hypothetical protein